MNLKTKLSKIKHASAAIAILGVLFKLQHWPFGAFLLVVGCCSLAFYYLLMLLFVNE
jgi:hypothetical protein